MPYLLASLLRRGPELAEEMLICAAWRVRVTKKTHFLSQRSPEEGIIPVLFCTQGNLDLRQGKIIRSRAAKSDKRQCWRENAGKGNMSVRKGDAVRNPPLVRLVSRVK
jgi:hypothetical protein